MKNEESTLLALRIENDEVHKRLRDEIMRHNRTKIGIGVLCSLYIFLTATLFMVDTVPLAP